jgi:rhamnose utilization protein RhaD (predicted bifunctional aldolase and dehydrogenase)
VNDLPDSKARYEEALAEVEEMKRALAARARSVAELEQRLMRQAEHAGGRRAVGGPVESDLARAVAAAEAEKALAAAERDKLEERERSIRKVERELAGLRIELEQERKRLSGAGPSRPPEEPKPEGEPPAPTPLPQPPPEPDLEPAARTARRRR